MAEMAQNNWKQLAEAARDEKDSKKLMHLVEQLNRSLDEHMQKTQPQPNETKS
jgi:hypothetical protein